jgi:colanic acid biosynthesis protein WcaH
MYKNKPLNEKIFETVINSVPLISIDILLKKNDKILLGKRVNKPAQNYYFSIGGRVFKNETLDQAIQRVAKIELNIDLKSTPKFIGVFEHFYDDSIYKDISTHYVDLAYELEVEELPDLPIDQHAEYRWFSVDELLESVQVHKYVKDYFKR